MNFRLVSKTLLVFTVVVVMAGVAYMVINKADMSRTELPYLGRVPDFDFVNQDNQPVSLNSLKGKITVVDFIFTRCKGPCPLMATNMSDLYNYFTDEHPVQFMSVSVDPEFDSLSVLKDYAEENNVSDNRWFFLHGTIENVIALCEGGFMLAADDLPGNHSTKFILVDKQGMIRAYYDGLDVEAVNALKADIVRLMAEK